MAFPQTRLRRLRATRALRGLVRETRLEPADFVYPMFVAHGIDRREPIEAMPGVDRLSIAHAVAEAGEAAALGIPAVLLFGLPGREGRGGLGRLGRRGDRAARDPRDQGGPPRAARDHRPVPVRVHQPRPLRRRRPDGAVDNDATLELLARTAVSQARAGADVIAPSDMMDGRVGFIRTALDEDGLTDTPILAYSRSSPRRSTARSARRPTRRRRSATAAPTRWIPANGDEAVREARLDVEEGADILMVKPALPYLDLIRRIKDETAMPLAAYNVSGEYAMVKAAAAAGYLDERATVLETLTSIRRAGADIVITYHAKEAAQWLQ